MEKMIVSGASEPVNIILVEDDDGDAKAVHRAFSKASIANPITRVEDGLEALALLRGEKGYDKPLTPYILLVDINMPRMDGIQFIKAMREDPKLEKSIVFVLTTSKRQEDKDAAYHLNVAGYIVKETAGRDFFNLVRMIDNYWQIVDLPV